MSARRLAGAASALLVLAPSLAAAQETGFAINRFEPAERGSQLFVSDTLDLRGTRPALGAVLDYSHKSLVVYDEAGTERGALVRHQLVTHAGGSMILFDRLRLAASVPVALYQDGEPALLRVGATVARYLPADKPAVGDVRLAADMRILGQYGDPLVLAAGVRSWLPTGPRSQFAGDGSLRLGPHVMVAGDVGIFTYAARFAVVYRALDDAYAGRPIGSELFGAAGGGLKALDKKLVIGPEVFASTVFTSSDAFFKSRGTPVEWLFGLHYDVLGPLRAGAGVGGGLTRAFGSPELRTLFSIEYVPPYQKPDRDYDGIVDEDDACPDTAGVESPDRAQHGCPQVPPPPPPDTDKDGIVDPDDACPAERGVRTRDTATNGCPDRDDDGIVDKIDACPDVAGLKAADPRKNGCPPDRDGDGIPDSVDACPDVPGVQDGRPTQNGCPPDDDGDGVLDQDDACPSVAGPPNADPKKNGCPLVVVTDKEIKIAEQVTFKTASADILPESDAILDAVKEVLEDHPEIAKVRVEGHTDNVGKPAYNKKLSARRAEAVVRWLVDHGVDKKRLAAQGFGEEQPIQANDTDAGRAANRRVAFTILERTAAP